MLSEATVCLPWNLTRAISLTWKERCFISLPSDLSALWYVARKFGFSENSFTWANALVMCRLMLELILSSPNCSMTRTSSSNSSMTVVKLELPVPLFLASCPLIIIGVSYAWLASARLRFVIFSVQFFFLSFNMVLFRFLSPYSEICNVIQSQSCICRGIIHHVKYICASHLWFFSPVIVCTWRCYCSFYKLSANIK